MSYLDRINSFAWPTRLTGPACLRWSIALSVLAFAWACGEPTRPPVVNQNGSGGQDGSDGEGGEGPDGTGGSEPTVPGAPDVEVSAPEEGDVLSELLSASCRVTPDDSPDASAVDPASIVVQLLDDEGEVALEGAATVGEADVYSAQFPLDAVPSGRYTVLCSASDSSSPPLTGASEVDVLVDHGPTIEPINPLPDSFLARAGLHDFEVRVRPVPLFDGDDEAELDGDPVITIDHEEFTLEPKGRDFPDIYVVQGIDFENVELFPEEPPDTTDVRVTASNQRAVMSMLDYDVAVDGTGPDITIVQPQAATIIGSRVTFVLQIDDDFSGVDWDSLVVEVKDVQVPFDAASSRWTLTGNIATLELNTTEYSVATQLSINVTVADMAGNLSSNGAGSTYYLDQLSPILSLDPPSIRVMRDGTAGYECSHSFDPVGAGAISHGDSSYNLVQFRAVAWDRTNEEAGQNLFHHAETDTTSMRLWVSRAGEPLVVDTPLAGQSAGDGICDAISSAVDADIDAVELSNIGTAGTPFWGDGTGDVTSPSIAGVCTYPAAPVVEQPAPLCENSDLTYAVGQNIGGSLTPAVYAPLVGGGLACAGSQQSVGALLGAYEGWVCAAVTGQDTAGNTAVSAPIAFCLDDPGTGAIPDCWGDGTAEAPDCTDTCEPLTMAALEGSAAAWWPYIKPNGG